MADDLQELRQEVRWLGGILGQVIAHLDGSQAYELEEQIRSLAKQRRLGDEQAGPELESILAGLDLDQCWMVCRAFTLFFDLANLAEDRHRVRTLKRRQRQQERRGESLAAAVAGMRAQGLSPEQAQERLHNLLLEPVFTAHPTEAKRRAVRGHLQRLRRWLHRGDRGQPNERSIREIIETLWHTDLLRPRKPTVLEEVERGLATVRRLWNVVPRLHRELREALRANYPEQTFEIPPFVQFGTWMGGDRDGNPFVTSDVSAQALRTYRQAALGMHLRQARRCFSRLTQSEVRVAASPELKQRIQEALWQWPALTRLLEPFSATEVHRRWLRIVRWRLNQSLRQVRQGGAVAGAYRGGPELLADLVLLRGSLAPQDCRRLDDWCVQTATFGFFLARLDIRQESAVYHEAIGQLLGDSQYAQLPADQRSERLRRTQLPAVAGQLQPLAQETASLFRLLAWHHDAYGNSQLGCHILSMTHEAVDILALLWLQRQLAPGVFMPLVPLFETIKDLERGPEILRTLLSDPEYRDYLRAHHDDLQIVMVGYSDSTKDGGYLAANWGLYRSQQRMQQAAAEFGVQVRFFHGRGGALGRGGGPAARSILSLPRETTAAGLRLTEQGEVLSERYDDPPIAHRHLEQLLWSLLEVNNGDVQPIQPEWVETLDRLAGSSLRCYRELVEHPGFIDFFQAATPIRGVERMAIGSRPSRRPSDAKPKPHAPGGTASPPGTPLTAGPGGTPSPPGTPLLAGLRAIPWVFSWTQNRVILPAWYGLGAAFAELGDDQLLVRLYRDWPFFRAVIDNAELALAKADMDIARSYARLVPQDNPEAQAVMPMLEAEFERSRQAILHLTGRSRLLESQPWLERSIRVRNPYVDPLNWIQVEVFRRLARDADNDEPIGDDYWDLLRMTIQGVAAGLRTTG